MDLFGCLNERRCDVRSGRMIDVRGGEHLSPPVETGGYKMLDVRVALFLNMITTLRIAK